MTQRPALDAASTAATAVLDPLEPLPQPTLGGYYDPDSSSFQPSEEPSEWITLAVNLEPEEPVPARSR